MSNGVEMINQANQIKSKIPTFSSSIGYWKFIIWLFESNEHKIAKRDIQVTWDEGSQWLGWNAFYLFIISTIICWVIFEKEEKEGRQVGFVD